MPGGFGNDNGPNWQQLTVELKDAVVPFTGSYGLSAAAKATASFAYHATDWESILMTSCQTYPVSGPLGAWSTGFAQPDGVGKLADDNRSVPLLSIDTDVDQTGTAKGKLRFNKAPR